MYNRDVMTPLRAWLKPPRSLLVLLFLLALVSVSVLGWFGWKLLDQERMIDAQRSQERLEQAADRIAATLRGALAETGERLGALASAPAATDHRPVESGLLLFVEDLVVIAAPGSTLLYEPSPAPLPEAPPDAFAEAEDFEFQRNQPNEALARYAVLASSSSPAMRAGALLREARVLRNSGRIAESRAAYLRLSAISGVGVAGAPAELVGRHAAAGLPSPRSFSNSIRRCPEGPNCRASSSGKASRSSSRRARSCSPWRPGPPKSRD